MAYLNYAGCRQEVPVVGGAWSTPVDRVYVKPEIVDENFHFLFHRRFFFEIVFFHDSRSTHAKSILIKLFINPVPKRRIAHTVDGTVRIKLYVTYYNNIKAPFLGLQNDALP
ncbi:hypothetical protein QTP88_022111 [Uroleucon formosanum]